jgi:lysophospholipid acyltransferase (LPLAT)-like uncharacterized protein
MPLLQKRIHFWASGLAATWLLRLYSRTWRIELLDSGGVVEGVRRGSVQILGAFWHRHILTLLTVFRGVGACVPVSEHRDGEHVAQVMRRYGLLPVRGSSTRGSVRLLRGLLQVMRRGHSAAITPDGPQGPRFSVQPGFALLARMAGVPVYPFGVAVERAWIMDSWDAFVVPRPGTRIVMAVGRPIQPHALASTSLEEACAALKEGLTEATDRAREHLRG